MKKHGLLLLLSCSMLTLAACGETPAPVSSEPTSESSSAPISSKSDETSVSSSESSQEPISSSEEPSAEPANGVFNYKYADGDERNTILGALEKYAVENKLTGLTLYGDGGYVMYNPVVTKGTNSFVPGYGFGILGEGRLTADLAGESNEAWKRYYHIHETSDPLKINYMDDKGAVVGDLIGYVSASYFDTQLNEFFDGYDWVGDLSTQDRPIEVDPDENGFTNTFKIEVKVGDELKYATTSEKYSKYNGQAVKLEDYITPYKIYYTKAYGMARGSENLTGASSLEGTNAYYEASGDGFNAEAWENVGIEALEEGGKSYLQFTFNTATTRFYAMYYLASSMFAPVPAEFIEEIGGGDFAQGVKNWGVFTEEESIIDHWLCTGPYMFERWDKGQQIVFKKNPLYADRGRYAIQGVHVNILTAAAQDPEAALNQFLDNKLHAVGIPSTKLEDYRNDPRTTVTSDSSTFKLNLNTCDEETWEDLFGVYGSVTQTAKSNYWKVKPAMHNKDFVSGLSYALDRQTLANALGRTPTGNYFGSAYMSDPEGGVAYNNTQAHKDAIAASMEGTDGFGYSLELAKQSFLKASNDMIAQGLYEEGDEIEIEIAWQTQAQIQTSGDMIATFFTSAFNTDENPLTLKVKNWVGETWSDVYYSKMMLGQFDIGFGSISGNTLDPINFMEVLKSDNTSGFTLNWGLDTNANDEEHLIAYDDKLWSYDGLWTVADHGGYVEEGANAPLFDYDLSSWDIEADDDYNLIVTGNVRCVNILKAGVTEPTSIADFDAYCTFGGLIVYGQTGDTYEEEEMPNPAELAASEDPFYNVSFTCVIPAATCAYYNQFEDRLGFDIYFVTSLLGAKPGYVYAGSVSLKPGSLPVAPAEETSAE